MSRLDFNGNELDNQIAVALEHLWDFLFLGNMELVELQSVKRRLPKKNELSRVDKGRAVHETLCAAIDEFRPSDGDASFSTGRQYYLLLTKSYIEGIRNKAVAAELNIGERTLYRYSIKAIQAVAQVLRDWEQPASLSDNM